MQPFDDRVRDSMLGRLKDMNGTYLCGGTPCQIPQALTRSLVPGLAGASLRAPVWARTPTCTLTL